MNEPLLEQIRQLERRVKRWRLISLALALLLILVIAAGGILTAMPATREPGGFWLWLPWVRARHEQEEMARREADALRQQIEAAKQQKKQAAPAEQNKQVP